MSSYEKGFWWDLFWKIKYFVIGLLEHDDTSRTQKERHDPAPTWHYTPGERFLYNSTPDEWTQFHFMCNYLMYIKPFCRKGEFHEYYELIENKPIVEHYKKQIDQFTQNYMEYLNS